MSLAPDFKNLRHLLAEFPTFQVVWVYSQSQDSLAKVILQEYPEVIQSLSNGKIYLKDEALALGANGIFLSTPNQEVRLQAIFSDDNGCYLDIANSGIVVTCGNCGYEFEITELVTWCPNCGHGQWPK